MAKGIIARILTLVDFSENSRESLSAAAGLTRLLHLKKCLALNVVQRRSFLRGLAEDWAKSPECGMTAFSAFMKSVNTHGQAIILRTEQNSDLPRAVVDSIRQQDADLLVIGPSSSGCFDQSTFRILDESPVPVLLVQPEMAVRSLEPMSRV